MKPYWQRYGGAARGADGFLPFLGFFLAIWLGVYLLRSFNPVAVRPMPSSGFPSSYPRG